METYRGSVLDKYDFLREWLPMIPNETWEMRRNKLGLIELSKLIQFSYLALPHQVNYPELHMSAMAESARFRLTEYGCTKFIEVLEYIVDFHEQEEKIELI